MASMGEFQGKPPTADRKQEVLSHVHQQPAWWSLSKYAMDLRGKTGIF